MYRRWSHRSDFADCVHFCCSCCQITHITNIERVVSFTCANQSWLHTLDRREAFMLMTLYTTARISVLVKPQKVSEVLDTKAFRQTKESIPPATRVSEWLSIAAHSLSGSASVKPTWTDNDFHLSFITRTKLDYWEKSKFLQVLDQTRPLYASNITNYD